MKKQNRLLRVLSRLNGKQKNMTDVLNVLATRPSQQGPYQGSSEDPTDHH